jgi:hypothetical protein
MRCLFTLVVPLVLGLAVESAVTQVASEEPHFVGSETCRTCHAKTYEGWKQTRMANVGRDSKIHPEAVLVWCVMQMTDYSGMRGHV